MLQTNKKNDVVTLKLVSGEEIIGHFVSNDINGITLRKPVVPVPTSNGNMGLAPFIMSSDYLNSGDGEITFNHTTVITTITTGTQFKSAYARQVSGFDLVPSHGTGLIT
jgi:hypothetical protein